ncbi:MAG: selenide, water dikinase SelD [Cyanobium sp.]
MQGSSRGSSSIALPQRLLLLAGGGHSHALVLRRWAMDPVRRPAGTLITLVNRTSTALYSGMVPGLVAGLYQRSACAIDLRRLCSLAGVSFIQAEITGLDLGRRQLELAGRPPLRFDTLSLDVGALTAEALPDDRASGPVAVKPLEPFLGWSEALEPGASVRIRGGGAAAVELALALRSRGVASRLLLRGDDLHFASATARRAVERLLAEAAIPLERHSSSRAPADLACTGSRAPAWLAAAGLPVQAASGRVLTEPSLAVIGHPQVFASGDCGLIAAAPRPAAGVWAVRAAPVLATNLQRQLQQPGVALQSWSPPAWSLQLLGVGAAPAAPGEPPACRALALWGPFALGPYRWLWHGKQWIDRRFMARFSELGAVVETAGSDPMADSMAGPMACRGCGAKLAARPLSGALARLEPSGQAPPAEDAAVLGMSSDGDWLLQSLDGFPALVDDPWLNARLTTLHACSDLWACGASVHSVQALVTVPQAAEVLQEELLFQTLAGVRSVLEPLGAALIGGHTLEGRDGAGLALALTVHGRVPPRAFWPKGPLCPGDVLLLSRPLGSGVLFAAAMAGAAEPQWIDAALAEMQRSQAALVPLLASHGVRACTDVTGFGLLGHLGEMLAAAPAVQVALSGEAIPALPGALELLRRGYASSLSPANASALALLAGPVRWEAAGAAEPGRTGLLLDPQTCGPLLAALPAERAAAALAELHAAGFVEAALIARVLPVGAD